MTGGTTHEYSRTRENLAMAALFFGNFVIGVGILIPAGLINQLSEAFHVSIAQTASLVGYGALMLSFQAPVFAFLTNRMQRHHLISAALVLYAIGHLLSALMTDFYALLAIRLVMVSSAAIVTPQATSSIGLFVRPERRAASVTMVFMGWTLATAIGLPFASLLSAYSGWQTVYLANGIGAALAATAVWFAMPHRLLAPSLSLAAWADVFSSRAVLLVVAVTILSLTGQFCVYPFIAADLKAFGAGPETIALLLSLYGFAGITGALVSTRLVSRIGPHLCVCLFLGVVVIALILWGFSAHSFVFTVLALLLWGIGFSPSGASQQARMLQNAPHLAAASISLNSAMLYVGHAAGTLIGATLLSMGQAPILGFVGAAIVFTGLSLSLLGWYRWRI